MRPTTSPYMDLKRIEYVITYQCTGRCTHCQMGSRINRPGETRLPPEMLAGAVREAASQYAVESVMTFGGEPLLRPEATCAVHAMATACGIPVRQVITNGHFAREAQRIRQVAQALAAAGVNSLLLSVDAFHQATIPLEAPLSFARAAQAAGIQGLALQPSWVVRASHENPYNARTRAILAAFDALRLPVAGNDIFMAGNAARHLASFYDPPSLSPHETCGALPYTEPLTHVTSVSIEPGGNVMACGFPLGNLREASLCTILARYDPFANPFMRAIVNGGLAGLLAEAQRRGIGVDMAGCHSICDVCHAVTACAYGD